MHDRALDFSGRHPSPGEVVGFDLLGYLGVSRPNPGEIAGWAAAGSVFTFIWETDPNRSQQGWNAGIYDAVYGNDRADGVGYPLEANLAWVVSDGNARSPDSGGDRIADYADALVRQSKRPVGPFYGNRYAVDAAIRGARRSGRPFVAGPDGDGGWLPHTWGADPSRDPIIQEPNIGSPIPGTDLNSVHHDYRTAGPGPAPAPALPEGDNVIYNEVLDDGETHRYWQDDFGGLVQLPDSVAIAAAFQHPEWFIEVHTLDILALAQNRAAHTKQYLDNYFPEPATPSDGATTPAAVGEVGILSGVSTDRLLQEVRRRATGAP